MISPEVQSSIESALSKLHNQPVVIKAQMRLAGGCINETAKIETSINSFFIKLNNSMSYPRLIEAEVKGLSLLKAGNNMYVPDIITTGKTQDTEYLILELIKPGIQVPEFWEDFGRSLAGLHKNTNSFFGLDHANYIGSLPQSNRPHSRWIDFFIHERLEPLLKLGQDNRKLQSSLIIKFEKLFNRLNEIFPDEKPSLIHGDLWNGNFMVGPAGKAYIFDPAVYYGNREMDISMTRLFGGFDPGFYSSYNSEFPLIKGWEQRTDICNLYPLLVHVNLFFGGTYLAQVEQVIRKF